VTSGNTHFTVFTSPLIHLGLEKQKNTIYDLFDVYKVLNFSIAEALLDWFHAAFWLRQLFPSRHARGHHSLTRQAKTRSSTNDSCAALRLSRTNDSCVAAHPQDLYAAPADPPW
jgi:hypothetical protein